MKSELSVFKIITYYLVRMGFQARNRGYRYLRDAVILGYQDNTLMESVTKRLYPLLAQRYGVNVFQIESSIRNTIELAWEDGNRSQIHMCLGTCESPNEIRPTNSEVIERLVCLVSKLS